MVEWNVRVRGLVGVDRTMGEEMQGQMGLELIIEGKLLLEEGESLNDL